MHTFLWLQSLHHSGIADWLTVHANVIQHTPWGVASCSPGVNALEPVPGLLANVERWLVSQRCMLCIMG